MYFKSNLIIVLVVVNLLLLFFLLSKRETFFNKAAIIDSSLKNKVKIDSNLLLDATDPKETGKKNAQLFIDGNVRIGSHDGVEPQICFGNECYSSKRIKDFLKYKIPYEVFETDPVKQETPDRLCYQMTRTPVTENCITGDDLKILNGNQPVYIAGPKEDENTQPFYTKDHLKFNIGSAPHYYYDINENYYERNGKPHKYTLPTNFKDPDCIDWGSLYTSSFSEGGDWNNPNYQSTGVNEVPYFYNLDKLDGWGSTSDSTARNQRKTSADIDGDGDPDGILQMVKQPVHKKRGVDFDADNAFAHKGNYYTSWWDRCKEGSGSQAYQNFQLMNIAAVNLMPMHFNNVHGNNINTKDKIKYIMKPGEETGLKCLTT